MTTYYVHAVLLGIALIEIVAGAAFFWHYHKRALMDATWIRVMCRQLDVYHRTDKLLPANAPYDPGICHVCGLAHHRDFESPTDSHGAIYCSGGFGFGSLKDMTIVSFCICETCYDSMVFAVRPRVFNQLTSWFQDENGKPVDENGNHVTDEW